jgi:uncharacterized membrane protein YjjP (DUF1212 family)
MEDALAEQVAHRALQVGRILLGSGSDTAQIRSAMTRFAATFGCEAHLMVSYEAILLTVLAGDQFRTKIGSRIPAMNVNMAAVTAVTNLLAEAERGGMNLSKAGEELDLIEHLPPVYGRWLVILAIGLTAGSLARLFGSDWATFWITWVAGSFGMWLRQILGRLGFNLFLIPFAGALAGGVIGGVAVRLGLSSTPALCLVAPGMIIVPGVPLVNGVQDIIRNHMTMGLARLGLGLVVTLAIASGLVVATVLTGATIPLEAPQQLLSVPEDALFSALAAVGYLLLFNVPVQVAWAGVLCGLASHTIRTLSLHLGIDIISGTLIGALVVGFLAHRFARHFAAPAVAFAFPGVVAMVPGAFAFRAVIGVLKITHDGAAAGSSVVNETIALVMSCILMVGAIAIGIATPLAIRKPTTDLPR